MTVSTVTDAVTNDPYPWVTIDEKGEEFRTHTAHEDGPDANGNVWEGWTFSPRTDEELDALGFAVNSFADLIDDSDPEPWVTIDENGKEYRYHTAHEDGVDAYGNVWSGWTFSPRSPAELEDLGY